MTDAELREIGTKFLKSRREAIENDPDLIDPSVKQKVLAELNFIDPLRMGLYAKAKGPGVWTINIDHIRAVCVNVAAFVVRRARPESGNAGELAKLGSPSPCTVPVNDHNPCTCPVCRSAAGDELP